MHQPFMEKGPGRLPSPLLWVRQGSLAAMAASAVSFLGTFEFSVLSSVAHPLS